MYDPDANAPPFNPLPPFVVFLVVLIGAPEIIFQLGEAGIIGAPAGYGWRGSIALQFGFSNATALWMWETGNFPAKEMLRYVSYMFVHANVVSVLFNVVFVLAIGKYVSERANVVTTAVVFFGSGILAAGLQAIARGPDLAMLGAGAAAYGLIGALSWLLFIEQRAAGENGLRAFVLLGSLAVLHLIFVLLFGGSDWVEKGLGFAVGFILCAMLKPNQNHGFGYWMDILRQR